MINYSNGYIFLDKSIRNKKIHTIISKPIITKEVETEIDYTRP